MRLRAKVTTAMVGCNIMVYFAVWGNYENLVIHLEIFTLIPYQTSIMRENHFIAQAFAAIKHTHLLSNQKDPQ